VVCSDKRRPLSWYQNRVNNGFYHRGGLSRSKSRIFRAKTVSLVLHTRASLADVFFRETHCSE